LKLSQLSNGYRNMLALVMDFARRMAQANPNLSDPLQGPGILLIDEIDLHIHPSWQQRIVPDLRKVFPNTQLIVTTHSPEVVTTVQRQQVQVLEDYQVLPCPNPTYGAKTSDVVRSVLGLKELRPPDNEVSRDITLLFQAVDRGDLREAKTIREKLRQWDSEGYDPDLTRADMRIRRLEQKGTR
jgi:predicted ATP-binding protein involved in virulence